MTAIKKKTNEEIVDEICRQLEMRGELIGNEKAFQTMCDIVRKLYGNYAILEKSNATLKNNVEALENKIELYEENATSLFQISQPTATKELVVEFLNDETLKERIAEANSKKKYLKDPPVQSFEPTYDKPYEYIITTDGNEYWKGFPSYEDALRYAKDMDCIIWELEWDKFKGDWKLVNGEQFISGEFKWKTEGDFLHFGTIKGGFLKQMK